MTDEDIVFDYYTVLAYLEGEDEENPIFHSIEEARINPAPVPKGGSRVLEFKANQDEFQEWYEDNVGLWDPI